MKQQIILKNLIEKFKVAYEKAMNSSDKIKARQNNFFREECIFGHDIYFIRRRSGVILSIISFSFVFRQACVVNLVQPAKTTISVPITWKLHLDGEPPWQH